MKLSQLKVDYHKSKLTTQEDIRLVSGIYFLLQDNEIVYVGKGENCLKRICDHVIEMKKKFDDSAYVEVPSEFLDLMESLFIELCKPIYNKAIPQSESPLIVRQLDKFFEEFSNNSLEYVYSIYLKYYFRVDLSFIDNKLLDLMFDNDNLRKDFLSICGGKYFLSKDEFENKLYHKIKKYLDRD